MDRFYLDNAALYQKLVKGLSTSTQPAFKHKTGATTLTASSDVTVSARIRPLLNEDAAAGFPCAVYPRPTEATDADVVDIHDLYNHPRGRPILKSSSYQVDRLFNHQATTQQIYDHLVADLVDFAWSGGVGTLFAYGQTGSGKTFTISQLEKLAAVSLMTGSNKDPRNIYMTVIDLAGNSAGDLLNSNKPISILEDSFGTTQLAGAIEHHIQDKDEMLRLIDQATFFRRTAPTFKNDASSRSHAVCRLRVHDPATATDGRLYLIDLAGSEAARDVAVHGADRMRETREINISLSVLKDCIRGKAESSALRSSSGPNSKQKKFHIPFRQSALTKVLKHVFDPNGNQRCKTAVIACVNPSLADVGASKNTLRYAEMLRVPVPVTKKGGNVSATEEAGAHSSKDIAAMKARSGLPNTLSSADTSQKAASMHFKERIRPGMVISWNVPVGRDPSPSIADVPKLAVVLCPIDTAQVSVNCLHLQAFDSKHGEVTSMNDEGNDGKSRYLCASVVPGRMEHAYEIMMWEQVIVDIDMMDKEVNLQYDPDTRYYHILL